MRSSAEAPDGCPGRQRKDHYQPHRQDVVTRHFDPHNLAYPMLKISVRLGFRIAVPSPSRSRWHASGVRWKHFDQLQLRFAMCYSAQLQQHLKTLARQLGADIDYPMFDQLFSARLDDGGIKIAKALEANFLNPTSAEEAQINRYLEAYHARLIPKLESQLFAQRKRLADAERTLKTKQTKKALEDQRIATAKIHWHVKKLADLKRTELNVEDGRIFPFWYAPVIVQEGDRRWVRPMRYHCRPKGKPAFIDRKFDGLYNAFGALLTVRSTLPQN